MSWAARRHIACDHVESSIASESHANSSHARKICCSIAISLNVHTNRVTHPISHVTSPRRLGKNVPIYSTSTSHNRRPHPVAHFALPAPDSRTR